MMIPNLSKGMIDDMQQLRKRMRSEFGVELRFSQDDIIDRITELAGKSKDQRTRSLFDHLKAQMDGILEEESVPSPKDLAKEAFEDVPRHKLRVYRGQRILEEPKKSPDQTSPERIYRGQVVR